MPPTEHSSSQQSAAAAGSDWDLGRYERIAFGLLPAASAVLEAAAPRVGERVLDIGCGNGNAALIAAASGATVVGVDPAERLLQAARAEASAHGVEATFVLGEAAALPLEDAWADVVLSVFGVIFAADAPGAMAEISRVSARDARLAISAWLPGGPISEVVKCRREAIEAATGTRSSGPPPFPWHDPAALTDLLAPYGFALELTEHPLAFTSSSPEAFLDAELRDHPMWVTSRGVLESGGELDRVREQAIGILASANESSDAFRVTSTYIVVSARRFSES